MIHEIIATGNTVDAAFEAALAQLNAPADVEVKKEILEMPVKKTFGLFGGAPAKVKAYYEETQDVVALKYFKNIIELMGFNDAKIDSEKTDNGIVINLECEDYGIIIGRRGETLDAIQYLTGLVANRSGEGYYRVTINAGNYREKRSRTLESLARRVASQVQRDGKSVTLEPMNPYERRIIHTTIQKMKAVSSNSTGDDNNRCVVISLAEGFKPSNSRPRSNNFSNNNRPRQNSRYSNNRGGFNNSRPPQNNSRPNRNFNKRDDIVTKKPVEFEKKEPTQPKSDATAAPLYGRLD